MSRVRYERGRCSCRLTDGKNEYFFYSEESIPQGSAVLVEGSVKGQDIEATAVVVLSGKEAENIGWATKSVPSEKLEEEVEKVAERMKLLPKDGIMIGKASNQWICDIIGLNSGLSHAYITHTLFTNLRFEPGEYNFVKGRKDKGTREGIHKRDERYKK